MSYARDGCSRWYPGKGFVKEWEFGDEHDPGLRGFLEHNEVELRADKDASSMLSYNFMIGLIADDIE
eukprot:13740204-Heterocapsa_arctica.AAC.1